MRSTTSRVHYGRIEALKGIIFDVDEGEIVTLIGANGAGKTTTMRTISGIRGRDDAARSCSTARTSPRCARDLRVIARHLPGARRPRHLPRHDGAGEPRHGRLHPPRPPRRSQADLERVFELFPRLAERRTQTGGTMSGGEQQMLAIGRALMARPRLLLLDEPSMGLAPMIVQQIFDDHHRDQPAGHDGAAGRAERRSRRCPAPTARTCWRPAASSRTAPAANCSTTPPSRPPTSASPDSTVFHGRPAPAGLAPFRVLRARQGTVTRVGLEFRRGLRGKPRLLLLDGHSSAYRAFHALPGGELLDDPPGTPPTRCSGSPRC